MVDRQRDSADARTAFDDFLGMAGVFSGVDGLRPAPDFDVAAAGRAGTRRSGTRGRRPPRPGYPRRDAAAGTVRPARRMADGIPDLRARIFDRRLPAVARHGSD